MTEDEKKRQKDEAVKMLDAHVNALSEHFENVQIFCSRVMEGGDYTFGVQRGAGNFYAREGQVSEWLAEKDEETRDGVREKLDN